MKKIIALLLAIAALVTLCGCNSAENGKERKLSEKEAAEAEEKLDEIASVFNKTIHDFEGYEIYNLDASEDNNFVVWQKGVKEIELSDSVNIIEEADEESLTFKFKNADETLKSLQKDDVFYGMSADGVTAVAGKVKSIEVSGDTVSIEGAKMELGDLYAYIDIDMYAGVENAVVGELPEGVTMEYVTEEDTAADMSAAEETYYAGTLAAVKTEEAYADTLGFGGEWHLTAPALRFTVSLTGHYGDASLKNDLTNAGDAGVDVKGTIALTGKYTYTMKGIDAAFHFMEEGALLYIGAQVRSNSNFGVDLTGSGTISINQLIAPSLSIPVPGFPLLKIGGKLSLTASASGSIKGGISSSQDHANGFQVGYTVYDGFICGRIEEASDPDVKINVEELSGTVLIGPVFHTEIGVWGTANAYCEAFGGLEFKGSYDPFETTFSPEEAVHDCDVCIDGSIDFLGRIRVGAKTELPGLKQRGRYWTLPELRHDFMDFYISFGREGVNEPEFGWEKCPYKRFRTDITVLNEGEKVSGAKVKAESADGRSFEETTDENGYAKLFLPVGDNLVTASAQGTKGTANVPIDDSPASVTINLTDERQIFVVCDYKSFNPETEYGVDKWPFITEAVKARYPDAIFVSAEEWYRTKNSGSGDLGGLLDAYGLSPGDIVIDILAMYTSGMGTLLDRQYYEFDFGYPDAFFPTIGMVMLPAETDVEAGVCENEPKLYYFYQCDGNLYARSRTLDGTTYVDGVVSYIETQYCVGLEFDEDFRLLESETTCYWTGMAEKDRITLDGAMTQYSYYTGIELYSRMNVECVMNEITPVVDALWNNEWGRDDSGDIVVSETP